MGMTNDLQAACERVRRVRDGGSWSNVYASVSTETKAEMQLDYNHDLHAIANAYLSLHDEKSITGNHRLRAENERLHKELCERMIELDAMYVKLTLALNALKQYADIANWDYLPSRDSIWIGPGDNPEQLAADALSRVSSGAEHK